MRTPKQVTRPPADLGGTPAAAGSHREQDAAFMDRFDWKGMLGQGGFGEVVAAFDKKHKVRKTPSLPRSWAHFSLL